MLKDWLLKIYFKFKRSHGFDSKNEVITSDQWTFGAIGGEVLQPNGQWTDFLPPGEMQARRVETMACTCYNTLTPIDILERRLFGTNFDYSERFTAILANIGYNGGSPHTAAEVIRKTGLLLDARLPFDDTIESWSQYYSPKPMVEPYFTEARQWLNAKTFGHEWIAAPITPEKLKEALKYSPLGIGAYAWRINSQGLFYNPGYTENHWTTLVGYVDGQYWLVRDSYDPYTKKLVWDYPFHFAKRYVVASQGSNEYGKLLFNRFLNKLIMRVEINAGARGEQYRVYPDRLEQIAIYISDAELRRKYDEVYRPLTTGLLEKDFNALRDYVYSLGGKIVEKKVDEKVALEILSRWALV